MAADAEETLCVYRVSVKCEAAPSLRRPLRPEPRIGVSGTIHQRTRVRRLDLRPTVRHNCGVTSEPLRSVRDHLSEIVDRVEREHDRVVITRNGREAAVLVSAADLAELEETLSVLSDAEALADIREADAAYARDDVVRGVDAVRALRS
jgi:antitoxin YefM